MQTGVFVSWPDISQWFTDQDRRLNEYEQKHKKSQYSVWLPNGIHWVGRYAGTLALNSDNSVSDPSLLYDTEEHVPTTDTDSDRHLEIPEVTYRHANLILREVQWPTIYQKTPAAALGPIHAVCRAICQTEVVNVRGMFQILDPELVRYSCHIRNESAIVPPNEEPEFAPSFNMFGADDEYSTEYYTTVAAAEEEADPLTKVWYLEKVLDDKQKTDAVRKRKRGVETVRDKRKDPYRNTENLIILSNVAYSAYPVKDTASLKHVMQVLMERTQTHMSAKREEIPLGWTTHMRQAIRDTEVYAGFIVVEWLMRQQRAYYTEQQQQIRHIQLKKQGKKPEPGWADTILSCPSCNPYLVLQSSNDLIQWLPMTKLASMSLQQRQRLSAVLKHDPYYLCTRSITLEEDSVDEISNLRQVTDDEVEDNVGGSAAVKGAVLVTPVSLSGMLEVHPDIWYLARMFHKMTEQQLLCMWLLQLIMVDQNSRGATLTWLHAVAGNNEVLQMEQYQMDGFQGVLLTVNVMYQQLFMLVFHKTCWVYPWLTKIEQGVSSASQQQMWVNYLVEQKYLVCQTSLGQRRSFVCLPWLWANAMVIATQLMDFVTRVQDIEKMECVQRNDTGETRYIDLGKLPEGRILDTEQKHALDVIEQSPLVVLTGMAGCGKSAVMSLLKGNMGQPSHQQGNNITSPEPDGEENVSPIEVLMLVPTCALKSDIEIRHNCQCVTIQYFDVYSTYNSVAGLWGSVHTVVVDEMSQIDEALFGRFVSRLSELPSLRRLVLGGDENQLYSVGAGQVLQDLISFQPTVQHCQLLTNHRTQSDALVLNSFITSINTGFAYIPPESDSVLEVRAVHSDDWSKLLLQHINSPWDYMVLAFTHSCVDWVNLQLAQCLKEYIARLPQLSVVETEQLHPMYRRLQRCSGVLLTSLDGLWVGMRVRPSKTVTLQDGSKLYKNMMLVLIRVYDRVSASIAGGVQLVDVPCTLSKHTHPGVARYITVVAVERPQEEMTLDWSEDVRTSFQNSFCTTVHSRQGGQAQSVCYVLESTCKIYRQLLYVAASRARAHLSIWVHGSGDPLTLLKKAARTAAPTRDSVISHALQHKKAEKMAAMVYQDPFL